jgi:hypothetical protein
VQLRDVGVYDAFDWKPYFREDAEQQEFRDPAPKVTFRLYAEVDEIRDLA